MSALARSRREHRRIRRKGNRETVLVRKHSTLHAPGSGPLTALELASAASAGAETLSLTATAVDGALPRGAQLKVAGDATVYESPAKAEADANALDVPIQPPLAQAAGAGTAVTIERTFGEWTYPRVRTELREEQIDGHVKASRGRFELAAISGLEEPEARDYLIEAGGEPAVIHQVERVGPTSIPESFKVTVGVA